MRGYTIAPCDGVGFMPVGTTPEQLNAIQGYLNLWHEQKGTLFDDEPDAFVGEQAKILWHRLVHEKRIDLNWKQKAERSIDTATMRHGDVREIGSEWIAYRALQELELDKKLMEFGWSQEEVKLAAVQIVSRAVYPASELGTSRWINDNSAVKELVGYEGTISKDKPDRHTVSGHPIVVLDTGIATKDNMETIRDKKYHYVCVSRSKIKDYQAVDGHSGVLHKTRSRQQITLQSVCTGRNTDYYLKVDSPAKAMKEAGMKTSFESRFELEVEKIRQSLHKKGGVKKRTKCTSASDVPRENTPRHKAAIT